MTWSGVLKIEKGFLCIDQKRAKKKKKKKKNQKICNKKI